MTSDLRMKTACSSETLVCTYKSTRLTASRKLTASRTCAGYRHLDDGGSKLRCNVGQYLPNYGHLLEVCQYPNILVNSGFKLKPLGLAICCPLRQGCTARPSYVCSYQRPCGDLGFGHWSFDFESCEVTNICSYFSCRPLPSNGRKFEMLWTPV